MNFIQRILHRPFFIKLLNWEYWSFNTVYGPIFPIWFILCFRARTFFFFNASNPSIEYGGFLMESKKKIYDILPPEYYPRTLYFTTGTTAETVIAKLNAEGFNFPLIGKPDMGGRGRGVRKLNTIEDVIEYAGWSTLDYLVQEFVPFKKEAGIFYYRYPNESRGHLSGIVRKEFLAVTGDGLSTLRQLCMKDKRFILQIGDLEKMYGAKLEEVLAPGVTKELVPYGNHARGAKFIDDSHLIDEQLTATFDSICQQVDGFYYGRLDVRYNDWNELKQGKNLSIIELNGAGSEPTHIYDPEHSLFFGWREIIRHWLILFRISRLNHKKGIPYLTFAEGTKMFRDNKELDKKLAAQDV